MIYSAWVSALGLTAVVLGAPSPLHAEQDVPLADRAVNPYAPVPVSCPGTKLVRAASGVNSAEASYVAARKVKADTGLNSFLAKTRAGFNTTGVTLPEIALTSSGGGLRALLCGAGVHQAFDARDSNVSTAGLYQALTYESGLSGGAWLLSSISANNWPTITSLKTGLWEQAFMDSALDPDGVQAATIYPVVTADIASKLAAGFQPTIVDPYGRLLSYQLLYGADGGVSKQVSDIPAQSNFTSHTVPFPILTALGVDTVDGQCLPSLNATQYEFSPYEFGSWDKGVSAFAQIKYLGSDLTNGSPTVPGACITNYDNQGYVLGTSSDVFNAVCANNAEVAAIESNLQPILNSLNTTIDPLTEQFALYPNPFKAYARSSHVNTLDTLTLADGGEADQNNPIWPFLYRKSVSVLIVSDNSADTTDNFPNGTEILTTYQRSKQVGLGNRMPVIPSAATFVSRGLNKRPTFFGCNSANANTLTIVWLPNVNYTFPSGESTFKIEYTVAETDGMIANGVLIGSNNADSGFGTCVGCAVMKKTLGANLPAACTACFKKFCYN